MKQIKYEEHQWAICVDLEMVNFLLGQQRGYTKYLLNVKLGLVKQFVKALNREELCFGYLIRKFPKQQKPAYLLVLKQGNYQYANSASMNEI